MTLKRVSVKIQPKKGSEAAFLQHEINVNSRSSGKRQLKKQPKNIAKNISIIVFGVVLRV